MVSVGDDGKVQHTGEHGLRLSLPKLIEVFKYEFLMFLSSVVFWKCLQVL